MVCGDDALTLRVIEELTVRYGEQVTAIVPATGRGRPGYRQQIAALPGVRVLEQPELDHGAFLDAGIPAARALAILRQDDLGNFHAALRAQELNPDLRVVLSVFNTGLGERIRGFFTDCAVLSEAAMAAPSFVAASLGEPTPSHVRVAGRTLYVARRSDVPVGHVVCGIAAAADDGSPGLLPADEHGARLVLAVADGSPRNPLARQPRHPLRGAAQLARQLVGHKLGVVFAGLVVVLAVGFALLVTGGHHSAATAAYLTALDAAGAAVTNPRLGAAEKVAQFLLTFDGLAFLPLVTAAVVGARLTGSLGRRPRPLADHVIVTGLGNVGTRVAGQLHDLGVGVVCVDKSELAAGVPLARRLGMRVVIGETHREETLRAAGIATCQSLVSVTDSDAVNLETALHARALAERPRIVVRLYHDDLAARVQRTVSNTVSRSVSYLAAPAFAAAMLDHQVLRTIPVGRHVLLIADVPVEPASELAGLPVDQVHTEGEARVIALRRAGADGVSWSPAGGYRLAAGDRLVVLATRAGLSGLLARGASGGRRSHDTDKSRHG